METKKFIATLGQNAEISKFLQSDNLMEYAVINVNLKEDGSAEFQTVENFYKVEKHDLDQGGQFVLELFAMFRNSKNAIASLLKHIETGKPITEATFKDQAKLTPKEFSDTQKKMRSFSEFWASLTPEQQTEVKILAINHFTSIGLDETGFQFFFLNGSNGQTLEAGQYVRLKDTIFGYSFITRVLQASPGGYVSLIDGNDLLTLSRESARTMQVIQPEKVPAEHKAELDKSYEKAKLAGEESRIDQLQKGAEMAQKAADAQKLADEKQAKAELAKKKSEAEKSKLESLTLNSMDEVKKFVETLNKKSANLIPAHKQELAEKVKAAKIAIKAKPAEATEATEPAPAGKEATSKKRRAPKAKATTEPATEPATEEKPAETAKA